jgi:hypothetical protein
LPAFLDFHSIGKYTENDLKKGQENPRDEFGVKIINIFYDMDSGTVFCLLDAPDRFAVERHHSKFGMKCDWITPVRMTASYSSSEEATE